MDYLEFIARVTSHIPDKGQVMIRYCGLYSNAHRGKIRKGGVDSSNPLIIEEEDHSVPSKGWAGMIRKVYEVNPLLCPQCGAGMKLIAFIEDHVVIDRIINHLKLTFDFLLYFGRERLNRSIERGFKFIFHMDLICFFAALEVL